MSINELNLNSEHFCPCCHSSDFSNDEISCKKCLTPQHLDCWTYVGSCSVFGCGSIKYVLKNGKIDFPVEKIEIHDESFDLYGNFNILGVLMGLSLILFMAYCFINFIF